VGSILTRKWPKASTSTFFLIKTISTVHLFPNSLLLNSTQLLWVKTLTMDDKIFLTIPPYCRYTYYTCTFSTSYPKTWLIKRRSFLVKQIAVSL
jgi:hypothetical protein